MSDLTPQHPNIVVALTDDHAQWALGAYGNSVVKTPTLDYLADRGVCFDNAFTPTPVCSPARASFWTGWMPSQHGVHDYLAESDPEVQKMDWLKDQPLLPQALQKAGYVTALVGKWHLSSGALDEAGFDYVFRQESPVAKHDRHAITEHAIEFLRTRETSKPFFLFLGHFETHSPWIGHPERLMNGYRGLGNQIDVVQEETYRFGRLTEESLYRTREDQREALAQYYSAVTSIDEQIGRVIDELDHQGIRAESVLIYTSDHGLNAGHHGLWGKGNATYPYNMLEESIRVPLIIDAPDRMIPRQRRSEIVQHCDLHATILDFAGIPPMPSSSGSSLVPLVEGKESTTWPDVMFGEYGDLRMVRTHRYKYIERAAENRIDLFDLETDPRETKNLGLSEEHAGIRTQLASQLKEYFDQFEGSPNNGLRVRELWRHNSDEAWRDSGKHRLSAEPTWLNMQSEHAP